VLGDLTKMNALLSVARQYLITDSGWDLLEFISQMHGLSLGNVTFRTLPIQGYITIDGQAANQVDPSYLQQLVQQTFNPPPVSSSKPTPTPTVTVNPSQVTVDVYNGGTIPGLAAAVSAALVKEGYQAGKIANASSPLTTTEVLYGSGTSASASKIASLFNVTATSSSAVPAGHVEVMLGTGATLQEVTATPSPSSPSSAVTIPTTGPQGGAVSAQNGIPCVN
jgi:hypothetical protein